MNMAADSEQCSEYILNHYGDISPHPINPNPQAHILAL